MSQNTITVSIGRNVGDEPMAAHKWSAFRAAVRNTILDNMGEIFVDGATSRGAWEGVSETSATWVAAIEPWQVPYLEVEFSRFCRDFSQDAIALTVGDTIMIGRKG
jgi:hypothetical protein